MKNVYSGQNNLKEHHGTKIIGFSFCMLFNCLYHKNNEEVSSNKFTILMDFGKEKVQYKSIRFNKRQKNGH